MKKYKLSKSAEFMLSQVCEGSILAEGLKEQRIHTSSDSYRLAKPFYEPFMEHHEEFWVIMLSRRNSPLAFIKVSQGGLDGTVVDKRIIFQQAVLSNACAMILVHNHPSGNLNPSDADHRITKQMIEAGKLMEIPVIDHIILTSQSFYSFSDNGQI